MYYCRNSFQSCVPSFPSSRLYRTVTQIHPAQLGMSDPSASRVHRGSFFAARNRPTTRDRQSNRETMRRLNLAASIYCLLVVVSCFQFADATSSPPRRGPFSWRAFLDATTGLASSRETSQVFSSHVHGMSSTESSDRLKYLVESYPTWLCGGPITFGCLQACKDATNKSCSIRVRFLNLELLSFGAAKSRGRLVHRQQPDESAKQVTETRIETFSLPIMGGLLSSKSGDKTDQGSLLFSFRSDATISNPNDNIQDGCLTIRTAIVGYRPWLAGPAPLAAWRRRAYLSSQSLIHAYVMWRYHRHVCQTLLLDEPLS